MHQAVDGRGRGHWVLEYLLPFAERQVAGQQHTPPFVPFREESEKHLHLLATLLNVTQVVDDDRIKAR